MYTSYLEVFNYSMWTSGHPYTPSNQHTHSAIPVLGQFGVGVVDGSRSSLVSLAATPASSYRDQIKTIQACNNIQYLMQHENINCDAHINVGNCVISTHERVSSSKHTKWIQNSSQCFTTGISSALPDFQNIIEIIAFLKCSAGILSNSCAYDISQ